MSEEIAFGKWLHQRRRRMDLTQQELADRVGCARITLSRIEAGTLKPSRVLASILLDNVGIPQAEHEQWIRFARGLSGLPSESLTRSANRHLTNLLVPLTSFIGREQEQAEVMMLINKHRLVTLTGSGGVGKTRLLIQTASKLLTRYPDGVCWVELASVLDPLLVPRATAVAVGLLDEPKRPVIDMLCDYLRDKKILILLDNCEHLIDACAQMVERILLSAPNVRILVSSREVLGIAGEVTYRVPSLGLPAMNHLPPVESLSQCEAVKLFVDRASSAVPTFAITNENAPALAQICFRLDGIPLAIELAAAKIRVLSVGEIARRLDDRFRLLAHGHRPRLERHQTLRAAIDWSYNLLSPAERILFRRLSVFVGGWTLEAAESVCRVESNSSSIRGDDVLNLLEQLIHKSLAFMEEEHGVSRYHMLETMRQYADEKLVESGESLTLRDRHLYYFLSLAEAAAPHIIRPEQLEWLARLEVEFENLRSALDWSLEKERPEHALRLCVALSPFWHIRCYWLEGAKWLERALAKPVEELTTDEKVSRARAFYWDADLAQSLGNIERSKISAEASLALCEAGTDRRDIAIARFFVGFAYNRQGLSDMARSLVEQSLAEFHQLQDWFWVAVAQRWLSFIRVAQGEISKSEQIAMDLEAARRTGERFTLAAALMNQAHWAWENQQKDEAEIYLNEAEALSNQMGFRIREGEVFLLRGEIAHYNNDYQQAGNFYEKFNRQQELLGEKYIRSFVLENLGLLARDEGKLQEAQLYYEEALQVAMEVGDRSILGFRFALLGQINFIQRNFDSARRNFKESLSVVIELDDRHSKSDPLLVISSVYATVEPPTAARILGAIQAHHEKERKGPMYPLRKRDFDSTVTQANQRLDDSAFNAAWGKGEKMSLDEAVALALKSLEKIQ